ncbi:MAG TPA: nucleoside deaminase [Candidatus Saccharimonadales bacterium]|nr:nucleoside deaminase [Candidatus Saccharimonadales bacterium]
MHPSDSDANFIQRAIELSAEHMRAKHGGPFGAIIVRQNEIIATGWNQVTSTNDPTAHAEITALRAAAKRLNSFVLSGCVLYSSCEPCPMCLGAAYWARVDRIVFAATRQDAALAGFDDEELYRELALPPASRKLPMQQILRDKAQAVLEEWRQMPDKVGY